MEINYFDSTIIPIAVSFHGIRYNLVILYKVTLPLYPPPLIREGEINYIREASPLFDSPSILLLYLRIIWSRNSGYKFYLHRLLVYKLTIFSYLRFY